jgi:hypothetical protein
LAAGCSFVPTSRLDECHLRSQALQAETARLKDEALSLRNQNRDLVQRALDDAHRVHALETTNERLERSLTAYQEERDQLVESFQQLERQVQLAADLPPTAMLDRIGTFARAHPDTRFDAEKGVWSVPAAKLFVAGTDQLRPDATLLLQGFANLVAENPVAVSPIRIVGRLGDESVRKVALVPGKLGGKELAAARASRLRDLLATRLKVAASTIEVATTESQDVKGEGVIEIGLSSALRAGTQMNRDASAGVVAPN